MAVAQTPREIDFKELLIGEFLGQGAFGIVYKAVWSTQVSPIDVAVKLMTREESSFTAENWPIFRVNHPNVVKIFGTSMEPGPRGGPCLVMELADGGSLYDLLHKSSIQFSKNQGVLWCMQCARGVAHLHHLRIIHRDLKSANLLIFNNHKSKTVKIADFDTARDIKTTMTDDKGNM